MSYEYFPPCARCGHSFQSHSQSYDECLYDDGCRGYSTDRLDALCREIAAEARRMGIHVASLVITSEGNGVRLRTIDQKPLFDKPRLDAFVLTIEEARVALRKIEGVWL